MPSSTRCLLVLFLVRTEVIIYLLVRRLRDHIWLKFHLWSEFTEVKFLCYFRHQLRWQKTKFYLILTALGLETAALSVCAYYASKWWTSICYDNWNKFLAEHFYRQHRSCRELPDPHLRFVPISGRWSEEAEKSNKQTKDNVGIRRINVYID